MASKLWALVKPLLPWLVAGRIDSFRRYLDRDSGDSHPDA
ncbi:Uncharacterised protein [Klebsiella pneumoniae]|uniref:Uncharacterized protein n=1 Tax=Klebsiella pneumoniae TaxID=573 RepID=A0A377XWP8_KLEPN|nr:Uncharacterised protein [Klebsiella pneumoniae]